MLPISLARNSSTICLVPATKSTGAPPIRSDRPPGPDQSRVANQKPGDQERCSQSHSQEIPLQSVSFQLRKVLGRHLSDRTVLPALTKVAWQIKSQEIRKDAPNLTRKKFLYNLSRSSYEKYWGATYQRPGIRSRMLAAFFRIVPRVGPFKALAFKKMTPEIEQLYMLSFNASIDRYRGLLADVGSGRLRLPNDNFGGGAATKAGQYKLADAAYAKLPNKLDGPFADLPQGLRSEILAFYQDLSLPITTKANQGDWARLQEELSHLEAINRDLSATTNSKVSDAPGVAVAK